MNECLIIGIGLTSMNLYINVLKTSEKHMHLVLYFSELAAGNTATFDSSG